MAKFNKLDVPHQWKDEFTKYPHGYTIFEALCKWVKQVDNMVDNINNWNEYLDNFVESFEFELQEEIQSTIERWQSEGLLDDIIESVLTTELDNVNTQLAQAKLDIEQRVKQEQYTIYADYPPAPLMAIPEDGSDCTVAVQAMIDYLDNLGGGRIVFPSGRQYNFTGELFLNRGIVLEGSTIRQPYNTLKVTILRHTPSTPMNFINLKQDKLLVNYVWSCGLKRLFISGDGVNSLVGFDMIKANNFLIEDVVIRNFNIGVRLQGTMMNTFNRCDFKDNTTQVAFETSINTTNHFNKCYFHFGKYGVRIDPNEKVLGLFFNDCVFESLEEYALDIGVDNQAITFNNIYTENVPSTNSGKPIIRLGKVGTPVIPNRPVAQVTINGGIMGGYNGGLPTDSVAFDCGDFATLTVTGVTFARLDYIIKTSDWRGQAVFINPFLRQVNKPLAEGAYNTNSGSHVKNIGGLAYNAPIASVI